MGGEALPSNNVMCDLVECCNYFDIGQLKYGECVAQFQGMGLYDGVVKCCGDYSAMYTACTIGGHVRYMADSMVRCCTAFNCNVNAGTGGIGEQKDYCCQTTLRWTCSPALIPASAVNQC